jgi:hypothetical protein
MLAGQRQGATQDAGSDPPQPFLLPYPSLKLALTWGELPPDFLTYHDVLRGLLHTDRTLGGEHQQTIRECFAWREISLLPGSMLLPPRTMRKCALGAVRLTALSDSSLR